MTWLQTVPTILVAVLIIFVPGALLARCLGTRGLAWAATAAPLTVSLVSVGAILAQKVHVRWSLGVLAVVTIVACAIAVAARLPLILRRRREGRGGAPWTWPPLPLALSVAAGFAVPVLILGIRFAKIFINPANISQTYDNVFHLNAIRFILNTGNGSSLNIGTLDPVSPSMFYPAAWHDLVALVVGATTVPIPVGVNAVNMVLGALVWTTSSIYLASRVLGTRPATFLATGALAAAFGAFPYLLMEFGVLYPNFLALTVLPVFVALAADLVKVSVEPRPGPVLAAVLIAAGLPGLALAHPSVLMAFGVFALAPLVAWLVLRVRDAVRGQLAWPWAAGAVVVVAAYVVTLNYMWGVVRPSKAASFWPPVQTISQAFGEALTNGPLGRPTPWLVAALTLVGIYAVFRRRRGYWLLGAFAISCFLFIVVSAFAKDDLRNFFTGVWYNDSYRLAAMLPVFALPVAAVGAQWLFGLAMATKPITALQPVGRRRVALAVGAVGWVAVIVLAQGYAVASAQGKARAQYALTSDSALLTTDENTLLLRVPEHVPTNGIIVDNPGTGGALAYALANRRVVLPAVSSSPGPDDQTLIQHLPSVNHDPAVCAAVKALGSFYVLDFGPREINGMHHTFPTSEQLATTPGLELVDHEGAAKLYRITACG
ncbi:DUF6541 family protein [Specibacter cremeus]|uniref:DUF6541 family protein n=1 Tax=Specibacter cremeus TaxID=1629051 RepID=UPI000F7A5979|nr:DUF6541 family protein [Specibacter cremeus]